MTERSFEQFARENLPALSRFAGVLCGERGLAEDVLQEVLLRAHQRWATIAPLDKPDAYVRRMVVNEFLTWRRKWSRIRPEADVQPTTTVPDHAATHADRDALVRELGRLPRSQRTVLVLRYYLGLSDAQIADELGCAQGTVRAHATRALARLRVEMNDAPTSLGITQEEHA